MYQQFVILCQHIGLFTKTFNNNFIIISSDTDYAIIHEQMTIVLILQPASLEVKC